MLTNSLFYLFKKKIEIRSINVMLTNSLFYFYIHGCQNLTWITRISQRPWQTFKLL